MRGIWASQDGNTETRRHGGNAKVKMKNEKSDTHADGLRRLVGSINRYLGEPDVVGADVVEIDGIDRGRCISVIENPASDLLELESGARLRVSRPNLSRHDQEDFTWDDKVSMHWRSDSPVVLLS